MKTFTIIILAALLGAVSFVLVSQNLPQGFGEKPASETKSGMPKTEKEFRDKLAEFRIDRETTMRGIVGLEKQKERTLTLLREKGVSSSSDLVGDLKDDTEVQFAMNGLKSLMRDIKARKDDIKSYDETISGLIAMLADIDRQNVNDSAKMSEEQYIEGEKLIFALRDKLGLSEKDLEEQDMRELLDSEMENSRSDDSDSTEDNSAEFNAEKSN